MKEITSPYSGYPAAPRSPAPASNNHFGGTLCPPTGTCGDWPRGKFLIGQIREEDVLVSVMCFGGLPGLGPLPTHESHEIGVHCVSRHGIALANALFGAFPELSGSIPRHGR